MIVLDTNVLSELMKSEPHLKMHAWLMQQNNLALTTTAVTVAEITYGLERLPAGRRKADLQSAFIKLLEALQVLPLDDTSAIKAGQFHALRDAAGHPSTPSDMMIAGITAAAGAILATRNSKDFDFLPLTVVDPWLSN